jgi:oligopeptide/dipeptide ABC transporter ATP-binding protein
LVGAPLSVVLEKGYAEGRYFAQWLADLTREKGFKTIVTARGNTGLELALEFAPVAELFTAPRHPYTRALLRSVPNLRAVPRERLATIGGAVPHPGARPLGCPFHPRCPEVIAGRCESEAPAGISPSEAGASCFHAMAETAHAEATA